MDSQVLTTTEQRSRDEALIAAVDAEEVGVRAGCPGYSATTSCYFLLFLRSEAIARLSR